MHTGGHAGSSERLDDSFDYVFAEANLHDGNVDTASDEFLASLESARQEIQRRRADREAALDAAELAAGRPHQIKHAPATSGRATPVLDRMLEQNLAMMPIFTTNAAAATAATISTRASKGSDGLIVSGGGGGCGRSVSRGRETSARGSGSGSNPGPGGCEPSQTQPQATVAVTVEGGSTVGYYSASHVNSCYSGISRHVQGAGLLRASLTVSLNIGGGLAPSTFRWTATAKVTRATTTETTPTTTRRVAELRGRFLDTDLESSDDDDDIGGRRGQRRENDDFDDEGSGAKPPATATAMSPPPPMQLSGMVASPSGLDVAFQRRLGGDSRGAQLPSAAAVDRQQRRRQTPRDDGDDNDSQYDDVKVEGEAEAQPSAQGGGRLKTFFKSVSLEAKKKRKLTKAQREQQQQQQQQSRGKKKSSGTSNGESGAARDKNATTSETEHSDTPTPDAVPASRRHQPQQQQQQAARPPIQREIDSLLPDSVPGSEKRDEAGKELREKISRAQARTAEVEAEGAPNWPQPAASGQAIDEQAIIEEKDALLRLEFWSRLRVKKLELFGVGKRSLLDCFRRLMSRPQSSARDHHDLLVRAGPIVRMRLDVPANGIGWLRVGDLRLQFPWADPASLTCCPTMASLGREADADAAKADHSSPQRRAARPEIRLAPPADLIRQARIQGESSIPSMSMERCLPLSDARSNPWLVQNQ
uniref:C2 domain-containing protein n=1 Tax=Macrostomum lignano TaxID=282301 RepID=A0A1I8JS54_9PLAT